MDSSVVVLVIFMVVLFVAAGLVAMQFHSVDKQSKANKKLIIDKHHEVSADLTDLTMKLASEISTLEKSSTAGDEDLMSRLSVHKTELETLKTEVNARMVALEEYDTISKETFEASAKLLKELSDATQAVADEFTAFRTGQNEFNTDVTTQLSDVTTKLSTLAAMDQRLDSDLQALKVVEGRVDQQQTVTTDLSNKVNRLKFDDKNDTFYVCGADEYDCRQLAFVPRATTAESVATASATEPATAVPVV